MASEDCWMGRKKVYLKIHGCKLTLNTEHRPERNKSEIIGRGGRQVVVAEEEEGGCKDSKPRAAAQRPRRVESAPR